VQELEARFGSKVAQTVYTVTNEPGQSRASKHEVTYPKIRANPDGLLLKLCDRIANVEQSYSTFEAELKKNPKRTRMKMYMKEWEGFKAALYTGDPDAEPLWKHLDGIMERAHKLQADAERQKH
jgi:(p)ppGpp synthase/HD superfamily hydrolase